MRHLPLLMKQALALLATATLLAGCGKSGGGGLDSLLDTSTPTPVPVATPKSKPTPKPGDWMWEKNRTLLDKKPAK